MKFILTTALKIILWSIIVFIPVCLFITLFAVSEKNIPLWNIGIRNVAVMARYYLMPSLAISYIISALMTAAFIDKVRVRSIIMLHIPAVLAGLVMFGGLQLAQGKRYPLPIVRGKMTLGPAVFLKKDVFNQAGERSLLVREDAKKKSTVLLYDRRNNNLLFTQDKIAIDEKSRNLVISFGGGRTLKRESIPFKNLGEQKLFKNPVALIYASKVREAVSYVKGSLDGLAPRDAFIFLSAFLLSIIMIAIPLGFALNDAGWAFSGITGVVVTLVLLPYLCWGVFRALEAADLRATLLAKYSYLFPCIILGAIGIFMDILLKVSLKTRPAK